MIVRRQRSETPLAGAHEILLTQNQARTRRAIPWADFCPANYSRRALALAADQAKTLAEGEYGAVGLFGQLASALALNQVPFDLISASASLSSDEIRHADYCSEFAELCSGHALELEVDEAEVLRACKHLSQPEQLDFFILKYSAIGETLAGALLTECRRRARDPVARSLYTSLASDEVHHARLGWYYFAWRAPQWSVPEKQRLADRIARFVTELECYFWTGRDASAEAADDAKALGVLDSPTQRRVIQRVMQDELCPGLDAIGLSGSYAWQRRRRATVSTQGGPAALVLTRTVSRQERAVQTGARWLADAVDANGRLRLTLDARTGDSKQGGEFYHGRAALALMALERVGGYSDASERLRGFLQAEVADLANGTPTGEWPTRRSALAGSLALLALSGVEVSRVLESKPEDFDDTPENAWHAAQVVTAFGAEAPPGLWELCVRALRTTPWPCWTVLAARRLDDQAVLARALRTLQASLSPLGEQGQCQGSIPPLALVAAAVEALQGETAPEAVARIQAGQAYLMRWQIDEDTPGVDLAHGLGAFPLLPNEPTLRADVTAHALLALLPVIDGSRAAPG